MEDMSAANDPAIPVATGTSPRGSASTTGLCSR
jgi:hypothetical protein